MSKTIVGLSGSLRKKSFNSSLLRAAKEFAPSSITVEIASIREIPLYDGDVEEAGIPKPVAELKDRIAKADGVLLVTPEYNWSIPGVFKNTIDWLSRPPQDSARVFKNKPFAIIGVTPGGGATISSQLAWLQVMRSLGTKLWNGPRLSLAHAKEIFDDEGKMIKEDAKKQVTDFMAGYATFVG